MFDQRPTNRATPLFIFLVVASFLLMTFDVRASGQGAGGAMRDGAQALFGPLQKAATAVVSPVVDFVDGLANLAGLRTENERLRAELADLREQLLDAEDVAVENERLRALLDLPLPADEGLATVAARVISGPENFDYSILIDKGLDDGIAIGMPVVDEGGLVGRVTSVTSRTASVGMIIGTRQGVAVRALRTGDVGFVQGRGSGPLSLAINEAVDDLGEGDRIATQGSTTYPRDLIIGTVIGPIRPEAGGWRAFVDPGAAFGRLDFVSVIIWPIPDDSVEGDRPSPSGSDPEGETP